MFFYLQKWCILVLRSAYTVQHFTLFCSSTISCTQISAECFCGKSIGHIFLWAMVLLLGAAADCKRKRAFMFSLLSSILKWKPLWLSALCEWESIITSFQNYANKHILPLRHWKENLCCKVLISIVTVWIQRKALKSIHIWIPLSVAVQIEKLHRSPAVLFWSKIVVIRESSLMECKKMFTTLVYSNSNTWVRFVLIIILLTLISPSSYKVSWKNCFIKKTVLYWWSTPILWSEAQMKILNCAYCHRYSYLWLKLMLIYSSSQGRTLWPQINLFFVAALPFKMHFKSKKCNTPTLSEYVSGLWFAVMAQCLSQVTYNVTVVWDRECLGSRSCYIAERGVHHHESSQISLT